jgi:hypothetical protein
VSVRLLPLACLLPVLTACAPSLQIQSGWKAGSEPARPFSQVLVVAVSEDFDRRRLFENAVADELAAAGTPAVPSTRTMVTTDVLDRDSVTALVKATGVDAVLVTRLAAQSVKVKEPRGRVLLKAEPGSPDVFDDPYYYNVYTYDFSVSVEPSGLVIDRDITVTTDLFAVSSGERVYTQRSEVRFTRGRDLDQNTDVAVIDQVAAETVRRLRRDGAVR